MGSNLSRDGRFNLKRFGQVGWNCRAFPQPKISG
jgi:hypothetical protein